MNIYIILLISILSFIIVTIIFYIVANLFRYNTIFNRASYTQKIITTVMYKDLARYDIDFSWWNKQKYDIIKIKSFDNINLVGYYINNNSQKTALIVHGYGANAFEMQPYAKMFISLGYNVLAVDDRGHGKSDGKIISMGYYDKFDVSSWVDFLVKQNSNIEIVVFGISMGGATVCMYSSMQKPKNVKAIVSDCAYSSAYKVVKNVANKSVIFSILPTLQIFNLYSRYKVGFKLTDVNVAKQIQKCNTPILLIHGEKDTFVPFCMQKELYDNCPDKFKYMFSVPKAGHAESLMYFKGKYTNNIEEFLKKYVNS